MKKLFTTITLFLILVICISAQPTVTTQAVTDIKTITATGNGTIIALGSTNPTAHGVCWNSTGLPTISGSKTNEGAVSATGAFTSTMTGLTPATNYFVRAYATNLGGTSYGSLEYFTTNPNPKIGFIAPESGAIGTMVTINGTDFSPIPAKNIVIFGAIQATVSTSTATSITVTVPAGAGSVVPVSEALSTAMQTWQRPGITVWAV
jgi:hypothetical protein